MEHMHISGGGDDAVKFGSDWSVGKRLNSYNVTVVNSVVGCGCNGLQFGSETLGDFHSYHFGTPATLSSAIATRAPLAETGRGLFRLSPPEFHC